VEVFDDHLALAAEHRFDEDIERNVAPERFNLEHRGVFRGRAGARELARPLSDELPETVVLSPASSAAVTVTVPA